MKMHSLGGLELTEMTDALISAGASHVLATAGQAGASITIASGLHITQPIAAMEGTVIDTMGAGDATLASTVKALMEDGISETSLYWADLLSSAMAVAAATCRSHGALLQIPAAVKL